MKSSSAAVMTILVGAGAEVASATSPAITAELVNEINSKQSSWTAHLSPRFANATVEDVRMLCGTVMRGEPHYAEDLPEKDVEVSAMLDSIPESFDVRSHWPQCASVSGHIRDQSSCGSCWAFGSTEAFNDRLCIATGETTLLSPEDTVSNCGFFQCFSMGCNGGQPSMAWRWFKTHGVVTGGDFDAIGKGDTCAPYSLAPCAHHVEGSSYPDCPKNEYPTPSLGSKCSEGKYGKSYADDKIKATSSYSLRSVTDIQQDMMKYGSVTGAFTVYADFPTYKSGVYHHTSGSALGGHAIKMMGWGTENGEDYWLVANSWNEGWGDHGTFKIKRGSNECGIEGQVSAGQAGSANAVSV